MMHPGLLVTADDFGITEKISEGMIALARQGIVNRLSLLCNMPGTDKAIELFQQTPEISIGLHFNLTEGKALSGVLPGLTDAAGNFFSREKLLVRILMGMISKKLIIKEFQQQVRKMESAGISPNYLDSHQHIHVFPVISDCLRFYALAKGLKVRYPNPLIQRSGFISKHFLLKLFLQINPLPSGLAASQTLSSIFDLGKDSIVLEDYPKILPSSPNTGWHELMVHPYVEDVEGLKNVYSPEKYQNKESFFKMAFQEWKTLNTPEAQSFFKQIP
jgi:predicted glycoside hydrolase/deacetylase ChbG (UPF0249 family)